MEWFYWVVAALVVFVVYYIYPKFRFCYIVHGDQQAVVERFGKPHRVIKPGFHWIWPFETIVGPMSSLSGNYEPLGSGSALTKDGFTIHHRSNIEYTIIDPLKACYFIRNIDQLKMKLMTLLNQQINNSTAAELRSKTSGLNGWSGLREWTAASFGDSANSIQSQIIMNITQVSPALTQVSPAPLEYVEQSPRRRRPRRESLSQKI